MATTKKTTADTAQKAAQGPLASPTVPMHSTAPVKSAAEVKAAAALEAAAAQGRAALQLQMKQWEEAVGMFSKKQFSTAHDRCVLAATGPAAHISDKARSYAQICSRKMNGTEVD